MSKFDYSYMSNDDAEMVVFNKEKYSRDEVIKLAIEEALNCQPEDLEVIESYVRFGFYQAPDGEVYNDWHLPEIVRRTPKTRFEVPVWVVMKWEDT